MRSVPQLLDELPTHRPSRRRLVVSVCCALLASLCLAACGDKGQSKPEAGASGGDKTDADSSARKVRNRKSRAVQTPRDAVRTPEPDAAEPKREAAPPKTERVYRPSDQRKKHDDEALANAGIRRYASRRLLLYTDIDPGLAEPLPPLMDRVYEAWEEYFGPLAPDREGTDFQMTGYLMADRERFLATGLLPQDLPGFLHGRHRGAEFWMNDQADDYYRQHLMLHEGTHCFMTIVPAVMANAIWYMEGMAELFGTHATDAEGRVTFRVMPGRREDFPGLGRIRMVRDDVRTGKLQPLETILEYDGNSFVKNERYAWSWTLCKFLDTHPRYRERFRRISAEVSAQDPRGGFLKLFQPDAFDLLDEWQLFAQGLCHGYDIERAAIEFKAGKPVAEQPVSASVAADRGWQSSGVLLQAGRKYRIAAEGRFTLAQEPKPWESEAAGVSIRYCEGKPLGLLLGTIRASEPKPGQPATMLQAFPIGRERDFSPETTGTLYLRVNEFWNELSDNTGTLTVTVCQEP